MAHFLFKETVESRMSKAKNNPAKIVEVHGKLRVETSIPPPVEPRKLPK